MSGEIRAPGDLAQLVDSFDDPAYPIRVSVAAVTDPEEVPAPVVWMIIQEQGPADEGNQMIQLSFTRDQMREHIVMCQRILGSLPS